MTLLNKDNWQPTAFVLQSLAENIKFRLSRVFGWNCTIRLADGNYYVDLPSDLSSEEHCLGQSFMLGYAYAITESEIK